LVYLNGDGTLVVGEIVVVEVVLGGGVVKVEVVDVVVEEGALGICMDEKRQWVIRNGESGESRADAPAPKGVPSVNSFMIEAISMRRP
jgi:hypothetical protein